jgi:hypothetical protein
LPDPLPSGKTVRFIVPDSGSIALLRDHPVIRFPDDRATATLFYALFPLPLHIFKALGPLIVPPLLTLHPFRSFAMLLLACSFLGLLRPLLPALRPFLSFATLLLACPFLGFAALLLALLPLLGRTPLLLLTLRPFLGLTPLLLLTLRPFLSLAPLLLATLALLSLAALFVALCAIFTL